VEGDEGEKEIKWKGHVGQSRRKNGASQENWFGEGQGVVLETVREGR